MFHKLFYKINAAALLITLFLVSCAPLQVAEQDAALQTPEAAIRETAAAAPRFAHYLPFYQPGSGSLVGLVQQGGGWQFASIPYPANADAANSDYAPATDRLLAWPTANGVGPGNLAAGPLSIIDLTTQTEQIVIPDNVVAAGWAPNGEDFAYILATPDSYELYSRPAVGAEKLLAVDVPHSLRVSADGRFVAFTRESHYGLETAVPGLYVVEIATGKETQLSTLDRAGYGGQDLFWKPQWSPDGSQLLLYATADSDRAATPHEAGYVWAAADGAFSHFLPESAFLELVEIPLSAPENVRCLGATLFFASGHIITNVGECQPMTAGLTVTATVEFVLDAQTGAMQMQQIPVALSTAELLGWDVPDESLLFHEDGEITTLLLP